MPGIRHVGLLGWKEQSVRERGKRRLLLRTSFTELSCGKKASVAQVSAASREFVVPVDVLLTMSFLKTGWANDQREDLDMYGPVGLPRDLVRSGAVRIDTTESAVRSSVRKNIRAAAAIVADFVLEEGGVEARLEKDERGTQQQIHGGAGTRRHWALTLFVCRAFRRRRSQQRSARSSSIQCLRARQQSRIDSCQ